MILQIIRWRKNISRSLLAGVVCCVFFSGVQLGNEVSFRLMKAGVLEKCFAGFLRLGLVQRYI